MTSLYTLRTVLQRLTASGGPARPLTCNGLTKSAKGLFIAALSEKLGRPITLVTDKAAGAEELCEIIRFFMPGGGDRLLLFPPWEILPYEEMSPHPEVSGTRLHTLSRLIKKPGNVIIVTTVEALARKTLPPDALKKSILRVDKGDRMDIELLCAHLVSHGYARVDMVENRGEFAIRGGVVDVFAGYGDHPIRFEFMGDDVESIRLYNSDTQRSVKHVDEVTILPFREVFYHVSGERLIPDVESMIKGMEIAPARVSAILDAVRNGGFFSGMERLMSAFFRQPATLLDYLPHDTIFMADETDQVEAHIESFYKLMDEDRGEAVRRKDIAPEVESLFMSRSQLETAAIGDKTILRLNELALTGEGEGDVIVPARSPERYRGRVDDFVKDLTGLLTNGYSIVITAESPGGAERIDKMLREREMGSVRIGPEEISRLAGHILEPQTSLFEGSLFIAVGSIPEGFILPPDKWALITDDEIFGKVVKIRRRQKSHRRVFSPGLEDLKRGDLVVHKAHGVGRYIGSREMTVGDSQDEYLEIEYAEQQKLYLPISSVNLLKKYMSGGGEHKPQLDRMGGVTWIKTRARVKKAVMDMADRLLKIHASRELSEGFAYSTDGNFHQEFAGLFEYRETEDQISAIADVSADMERKKPMDRLVCGDVGYGKTEVAMRAAFKAVFDGKQAAILVPTTLLAQQHHNTFAERFKSFPVRVESLSRFKTRKEQKEILAALERGEVDIVVGTHRLLQKDVKFAKLGLVIVDEEQRFGVVHKEKLRTLSAGVDTMTLTATPIPRTLHTAMLGIRDLSVIETPPADRQAVQTFIVKFSDTVIREAILRELDRGGQIFFVHNKVKSIMSVARHLAKIVPEAKVGVGHGQMDEEELEQVMVDFVEKKFDVLIATTIIESGLDIPSANTIIINRADHMGLAQLYQLRGRVGRAHHRAFAYLLVPGLSSITDLARKRLKAIEELSELGSGFKLAARDMEIRGAGNLVGPEQSGHMDAVGFETYCEMLEDAIRELKGEIVEERFDSAVNLAFAGRIPKEYITTLGARMEFYNRIHSLATPQQVDDAAEEMTDRFGPLPEEVEKLLAMARIKTLCARLRVLKADIVRDRLYLVFDTATKVNPEKLVTKAFQRGMKFKFTSETSAEAVITGQGWRERFGSVRAFMELMLETAE